MGENMRNILSEVIAFTMIKNNDKAESTITNKLILFYQYAVLMFITFIIVSTVLLFIVDEDFAICFFLLVIDKIMIYNRQILDTKV
jgi:hypothetical protein